ncbi:7607_t:CDS:10 [Funneliformis geosporum]|nr:7607_t:CDS:10 [Funneliformis geosporum]
MTEIKILAKDEGIQDETFWHRGGGTQKKILVDFEHPELKKGEKIDTDISINKRHFEKGYCYEISFTDDESLHKKTSIFHNINEPPRIVVRDEDKNKRIFSPKTNITIKNNSYEKILKEKELAGISDKNSVKYKESRKFIEELETEFNKKTGKEAIVNRTPQQEQDLKDKKQELAELEREKQENSPNQKRIKEARKKYKMGDMVTLQEYLNQKYPNKEEEKIDIAWKDLEGELNLSAYPNLKHLELNGNNLTSTNFLNTIPNPEKLELTGLKHLKIGTTESGLKKSKRNYFYGSFRSYKPLTNLIDICIEATDVNEGLEHLPSGLAQAVNGKDKKGVRLDGPIPEAVNKKKKQTQTKLSTETGEKKIKRLRSKIRELNLIKTLMEERSVFEDSLDRGTETKTQNQETQTEELTEFTMPEQFFYFTSSSRQQSFIGDASIEHVDPEKVMSNGFKQQIGEDMVNSCLPVKTAKGTSYGLGARSIKDKVDKIKNEPDFYEHSPFLTLAKELLKLVKENKVEVIFLSAYDKRAFPNGDPRKKKIFSETFGKFPNCSLNLIGFNSEGQGQTKDE